MKKSKKKTKEPLPGYPHYPESEDIMNNEERADSDVENLSRSHGGKNSELKEHPPVERYKDNTPEIVPGTEAVCRKPDAENRMVYKKYSIFSY